LGSFPTNSSGYDSKWVIQSGTIYETFGGFATNVLCTLRQSYEESTSTELHFSIFRTDTNVVTEFSSNKYILVRIFYYE